MVNGKIHINLSNTGKGYFSQFKNQSIRVIDFRSAGFYCNTRGLYTKMLT